VSLSSIKLATSIAALSLWSFSANAAEPLKIDDLVRSPDGGKVEKATESAARHFYEFWNTGEESHLKLAISPSFKDHTLPEGRPQGPKGPEFASKNFRGAVPDLRVEVRKMVLSGEYATVHMEFTGHFTGKLGKTRGNGQKIKFIATDLIKVTGDKITDNWHIEDNLTLMKQFGVVK
jgi:predicted ester cyclase